MSMLGELLRETWQAWVKTEQMTDPSRHVVELAMRGHSAEAFALAHSTNTLRWEEIAQAIYSLGAEAQQLLYLALRHATDRVPVLLALGHWLASNNEPLRAYQCAQEAARLQQTEPGPLILMGWLHLSLGNPHAAGKLFLAAIRRDEDHREAWHGYRLALQRAGGDLPPTADKPEAEEAAYRQAIAGQPNNYRPHLELGKYFAISSRCALALPHLRTAHELAAHETEPAYWLAWSLAALGNDQAAFDVAVAALANTPGDQKLLKLAAECAARLGQEAQALIWLNQLIENGHADASVFNNLGNCLNQLEQFGKAAGVLTQAITLDPAMTEARHNLAYALHCLGRYAEAQEQLEILLESDKNDFSARWYRSTTLLANHRFPEGWRDYDFRFVSTAVDARLIPLPAWQGQTLVGRKIVVVAEQGIGDEIMFASCLPKLLERAGQCVIECNRRLVGLFRRSFPRAIVVEWVGTPIPPWMETHENADYHVYSGSLPRYFRSTIKDYASQQPFLVADPSCTNELRERLARLGTGLKVGIAWRGGGIASRARSRSLQLEQLEAIFDTPDCQFISIQYGDPTEEVAEFNRQTGKILHHWPETIADLDAFAALVTALDIIVTVCSAPVHFAGALGKPALVLTPFAPEWRYRGIGGRMVWYPSVRLFPQQQLGDWSEAIRSVVGIVSDMSRRHAAG